MSDGASCRVKRAPFTGPEHVSLGQGVTVAGVSQVNVCVEVEFTGLGVAHMSRGIQCDRQSGKPSDAIYGPTAR